ncbi:MAG: aminoglycoside adenylyltransferase domain-containing protein [Solirubrobacteraceae bacterium]|jgi:hypothetical protein
MLPALVRATVDDLLRRVDRALPGRIEGFYVVGSACLGGFRPGHSDLDFVAIVASELRREELAQLRAVHLGRWRAALVADGLLGRRWPLVCNGIYLRPDDLARSPLDVAPLAAHVAGRFAAGAGAGFDVNPVTWHMLAHHGIAVRGPERGHLQVREHAGELASWTLDNLNGWWRRWEERARHSPAPIARAMPRRYAAGGVLGAPRLHYTLATGAIATKEHAAQYARELFEERWQPLIDDALGCRRAERARMPYARHPLRRLRDAGEFVAAVIAAANDRWGDRARAHS